MLKRNGTLAALRRAGWKVWRIWEHEFTEVRSAEQPGCYGAFNGCWAASLSKQPQFFQRRAGPGEILRLHLGVVAGKNHALSAAFESGQHLLFDAFRRATPGAGAHGHVNVNAGPDLRRRAGDAFHCAARFAQDVIGRKTGGGHLVERRFLVIEQRYRKSSVWLSGTSPKTLPRVLFTKLRMRSPAQLL